MIEARIIIDGRFYCGESISETHEAKPSWSTDSWHGANNKEVCALKFSDLPDDAKLIQGNRSLKSEIDKVVRRIQDGHIKCSEIRILING